MIIRFIRDFIFNRDLWDPKYPSMFGMPVRSCTYECYADLIANGFKYEPAKHLEHTPRKYLKVSPVVDFSGFRNGSNLAVIGYTMNGIGELLALRMKMESGVEIDLVPEVT